MNLNSFSDRIEKLSKSEPKTMIERALKLSEECGEVAEAVLSVNACSGSKSKNKTKLDIQEELIDVLMVTLSMLHCLEMDNNLDKVLLSKLNKWERKMS